jgi:hypothetical protein
MKKPRKGVIENYYKALNVIQKDFKRPSQKTVSDVLKSHNLSTCHVGIMKDLGIIEKTTKGTQWIGLEPSFEMAMAIRNRYAEKVYERKITKTKQPAFEWAKPETTVKIEPNYEYKPQPDSSLVSEFIDHHEQSLLPPPVKRVKTAKIDVKTRMFQLRIFGLNLFTVKY